MEKVYRKMRRKLFPKIQEAIPLLNMEYLQNFSVTLKTKPEDMKVKKRIHT